MNLNILVFDILKYGQNLVPSQADKMNSTLLFSFNKNCIVFVEKVMYEKKFVLIFCLLVCLDVEDTSSAQLSLEFRVFLVNAQTGLHTQESRNLQFWFMPELPDNQQATVAQEFFKELVSPQEFPRGMILCETVYRLNPLNFFSIILYKFLFEI